MGHEAILGMAHEVCACTPLAEAVRCQNEDTSAASATDVEMLGEKSFSVPVPEKNQYILGARL